MIIKHNITVDYIHWASKVATSAYKRADKRIYKTESTSEGTSPQIAEEAEYTSVVSTIDASTLDLRHDGVHSSPLTSSLHL